MSRMIDAYLAYQKRWHEEHKDIKQPSTYDWSWYSPSPNSSDEHLENFWALFPLLKPFHHSCRYWSGFGSVYEFEGRVYEVLQHNFRNLVAVFECKDDWLNYEKMATIQQYHDSW